MQPDKGRTGEQPSPQDNNGGGDQEGGWMLDEAALLHTVLDRAVDARAAGEPTGLQWLASQLQCLTGGPFIDHCLWVVDLHRSSPHNTTSSMTPRQIENAWNALVDDHGAAEQGPRPDRDDGPAAVGRRTPS
ncbi:hypothetical protein ACFYPT_38880 [Streptomyces sp. NPDC005529]|uniref:hypothetical protein n=1 Tax=unclassified Streptomyces TaxID=2593676 RepID=UPI0033A7C622